MDYDKHNYEATQAPAEDEITQSELLGYFAHTFIQLSKYCEQEARKAAKRERVQRAGIKLNKAIRDLNSNG